MRTVFRPFILVLVAVVSAGCATAVFNPYIEPSAKVLAATTSTTHTTNIESAFKYGEAVRTVYGNALRDYAIGNRGAGLLAIGAATAAATLGISNGGSDAFAALGTSSVGLVGLNSFLYREQRLKIYAEGQRAVGCVLESYASVRNLDVVAVKDALKPVAYNTNKLNAQLAALDPDVYVDPRVPQMRAVVAHANGTIVRASSVLSAPTHIYEAVRSVQAQINRALIENEPDVVASVASLNQAFASAQAASAADAAAANAPTSDVKPKAPGIAVAAQTAQALSTALETLDGLLAGVGTVGAGVSDCAIKAEELGLAFRTEPPSLVQITTSDKEESGVVTARGGKPPYHARWVGQVPGAEIELQSPNHDTGKQNEAEIRIKVARDAAPGTFQLAINDEGSGRGVVQVVVRKGTATGGDKETPEDNGGVNKASTRADPELRAVQEDLVKAGCMAATRTDAAGVEKANADGLWGDVTQAAITQFDKDLVGGLLKDTVGAHGDADFYKKLKGQTALAVNSGQKCSPVVPAASPAPELSAPQPNGGAAPVPQLPTQ